MEFLTQNSPYAAIIFSIGALILAAIGKFNDNHYLKKAVTELKQITKELKDEQIDQGNRLTAIETTLDERK